MSEHGVRGVLDDDGRTVACHECGRRYRALATHLARVHEMSSDEYREQWGLARTLPLASTATRETMRAIGRRRRDDDPRVLAALRGAAASSTRARPFPVVAARRESTRRRLSEARTAAAEQRLEQALAANGWPDLAAAVAHTAQQRQGFSWLARRLGCGHTWIQQQAEAAGLSLPPYLDQHAEAMLAAAAAYAQRRGHLNMSSTYHEGDAPLGRWLTQRRSLARRKPAPTVVSDALDALDPQWRSYGRGPN